jgi:hypothetical protein
MVIVISVDISHWSFSDTDFFAIFRWLIFVFATIYVTITTIQFLWSWYTFLTQRDRYIGLLRNYLILHGLRIRVKSFAGDVVVCLLLSVAFLLMWRAHQHLDAIARVTADVKREIRDQRSETRNQESRVSNQQDEPRMEPATRRN